MSFVETAVSGNWPSISRVGVVELKENDGDPDFVGGGRLDERTFASLKCEKRGVCLGPQQNGGRDLAWTRAGAAGSWEGQFH